MIANYVVLLLVTAALFAGARLLRTISWSRSDGEVPLPVAVSACVVAFTALAISARALADTLTEVDTYTGFALVALILAGAPVIALYVHMVSSAIIGSGVDSLYGFQRSGHSSKSDFSGARARIRQHDVAGAVQKYREYFAQNPSDPEPLFLAAILLEMEGRLAQARAALREIMPAFRGDPAVWTEAAYRLANIERRLGENPLAAHDLFSAIVTRTPDSELGRVAREQLSGPSVRA